MTTATATTWRTAVSDVKGTHITQGAIRATELAARYMELDVLTLADYIALVRWSEGRPSYVAQVWS